jgi:hypothetical protein
MTLPYLYGFLFHLHFFQNLIFDVCTARASQTVQSCIAFFILHEQERKAENKKYQYVEKIRAKYRFPITLYSADKVTAFASMDLK